MKPAPKRRKTSGFKERATPSHNQKTPQHEQIFKLESVTMMKLKAMGI